MNRARLQRLLPAIAWQTLFLVAIDGLTNVTDYAFHILLGRALNPAGFAIVQTINAVLLVVITTASVLQPVVARFVAQFSYSGEPLPGRVVFQYYFSRASLVGLPLTALVILLRQPIAAWLNVPAGAVGAAAAMLWLSLLRPVVAGMLQGSERFVAFGLTRTLYAVARLGLGLLLVLVLGGGAVAAIIAWPLSSVIALLAGLALLGGSVWRAGPSLPAGLRQQGWRLSANALLAYAAYMSLLNVDLVWVNRGFEPATSGSYATAVLLRRALALLPGAIIIIVYPRLVAVVAQGRLPDRLLALTALVIGLPTLALTLLYAVAGGWLIRLTFGPAYLAAGPWLAPMGLAMIGYGLTSVWLNLYLATRPGPFVTVLVATALLQFWLLEQFQASVGQVLWVFAVGGWLPAGLGLLLYLGWLRPRLKA